MGSTEQAVPAAGPLGRSDVGPQLRQGFKLIEEGKVLDGRALLSDLFFNSYDDLAPADTQAIRDTLTSVNRELIFGRRITPGDTLCEYYLVQEGDVLSRIAPRYKIPYQLIEQINHVEARKIWVGQRLKVVRGPFHAIVRKKEFVLDVYLNDPDGKPVYVTSFPVGLGEEDSTPVGLWRVDVKVANPSWTNPRTREHFAADDPNNPIGEYWIGLAGEDSQTRSRRGFGIHGTIEPQSIGQMMSMGCIRMRPEDIEQLFRLLVSRESTVRVLP